MQVLRVSRRDEKDEALAWYKKILECDPATRRMDTAGEWNDYSRLKWGAEHGYLYAYPNDLRLYDKNPRQKLAVLLFDFYYVTDRSDKAEQMAKRLLAGDFGRLAPPLREYPQYAYATALYDTKGNDAAFREYLKILPAAGGRLTTWTQFRAALAAANVGRGSSDPTIRQASRGLYVRLIRSNQQNEFTDKARIELARDLVDLERRKEEGYALLRTFPTSSRLRPVAEFLLKRYLKIDREQEASR